MRPRGFNPGPPARLRSKKSTHGEPRACRGRTGSASMDAGRRGRPSDCRIRVQRADHRLHESCMAADCTHRTQACAASTADRCGAVCFGSESEQTDRSRWSAAAFAAKGVHASRRSCSSLFRAMATASSLHDRTGCGTQATNRARACGRRASTDTSAAIQALQSLASLHLTD